MFFGHGRKSARPIAGLHWGWLFIAAGAHAAGIYALTHSDIGQRVISGSGLNTGADGGAISVGLVAAPHRPIEAPAATGRSTAEAMPTTHPGNTPERVESSPPAPAAPVSRSQPVPVKQPEPPQPTAAISPPPVKPVKEQPPVARPPHTPLEAVSSAAQPKPVVRAAPADNTAAAMPPTAPLSPPGQTAPPPAAASSSTAARGTVPASIAPASRTPGVSSATNTQSLTTARFDAAHLRNSAPAYPQASRRRGEEGLVILRVRVGVNGRASEIQVAQSSGHPRLDRAAEDAVARWRFEPAREGDRAIDSWVRVPVAFRLERS